MESENEMWLLLVPGYGLINSNSNWQFVSNNAFVTLGLEHMSVIPPLFMKVNSDGLAVHLLIKIFDYILACGFDGELRTFIEAFS